MKCAGFSLIEAMIYCTVLAILVMTWFHGMITSHVAFARESERITQLSNLYAAQDILRHDIRQASAHVDAWKKQSDSEIIWHVHKADVGWVLQDGVLLRIEGNYDSKQKKWHDKKQSIALFDVSQVSFVKHGDKNYIKSITCQLTLHNKEKIDIHMALCNGTANG